MVLRAVRRESVWNREDVSGGEGLCARWKGPLAGSMRSSGKKEVGNVSRGYCSSPSRF